MKFKQLREAFNTMMDRLNDEDGERVEKSELRKLRIALVEKKAHYHRKLRKSINLARRDTIEGKLEVIRAQLKKVKKLERELN
ncbi:hypothetical protein [Leucothrix mucor]|uniref:hypothetical protein n=1 Tax=Leucothrix mucor TaxID=45248 RepID=UPI0003B59614|nr:hypothetical protein [Leucothrix mucor]